MTPLALELEGFTVYRHFTKVEWAGADTSLFAVTGPTGAGKSTLLDAITYVLYGKTARLGSKGLSGLVSPGAESLFARLTFRTARGVFRATRVAQRKSGSVGTEVRIEEAVEEGASGSEGGWRQLADSERVKDANAALERIVGLDYEGFTRAVLLPQGAFDEFLRGDAGQRRQLLSSLLGLDRVERVQRLASTKSAELKGQLDAKQALLDNEYADVGTEGITELQNAAEQLKQSVQAQDEGAARLTAQLVQLRTVATTYGELAQVEQKRAALQADTDKVSQARQAADRARRAAFVAPHVQQLQQAQARAAQAGEAVGARRADVATAEQELAQHRQDAAGQRNILQADLERLERVATALRQAQPGHDALVQRGGVLALAQGETDGSVDASTLDEGRWSAWQTATSLIAPFERALRDEAAALRDAQTTREQQAAKQLEVEQGAVQLEATVAEGKRLRQEDDHAKELLEAARRTDLAAAVREGLSPGDPCPVCGGAIGDHAASDHQLEHQPDLQAAAAHAEQTGKALAQARDQYDAVRLAHSRSEAELANLAQRQLDAVAALNRARQAVAATVEDLRANGAEPQAPAEHADGPSYSSDAGTQLRAELTATMDRVLAAHAAALTQELGVAGVTSAEFPGLSEANKLAPFMEQTDTQIAGQRQALQQLAGQEGQLVRHLESATARYDAAVENEAAFKADSESAEAQANEAVKAAGFSSLDEVAAGTLPQAELSRLEQLVSTHEAETTRLDHRQVEIQAQIAALPDALTDGLPGADLQLPDPDHAGAAGMAQAAADKVADFEGQLATLNDHLGQERQRLGGLLGRVEAAKQKLKRSVELRREVTEIEATHALYHQLNSDLHGHRFPEHLLTQIQQLLARRASAILQMVTDGRYDLRLESGDYLVADAWADGDLRSARTLSGGESFVASLALALALSDTLAGSSALGALFLDEGFGTLDRATLEAVTSVLESLTSEGRMVGVITHVPELSARLPARLVVTKGPGGSTVEWDA